MSIINSRTNISLVTDCQHLGSIFRCRVSSIRVFTQKVDVQISPKAEKESVNFSNDRPKRAQKNALKAPHASFKT